MLSGAAEYGIICAHLVCILRVLARSLGESEVAAFLVSYMPVGIHRLPSRDRQIDLSFDCPDLLTAFFTIDSSGFSLEAYDDEDADGVGDGAGVLPPFAFTENDLFSPVTCMMNVF